MTVYSCNIERRYKVKQSIGIIIVHQVDEGIEDKSCTLNVMQMGKIRAILLVCGITTT